MRIYHGLYGMTHYVFGQLKFDKCLKVGGVDDGYCIYLVVHGIYFLDPKVRIYTPFENKHTDTS